MAASRTRPRFFFCIFSCIRASHRSDVLVSNLLFPPAHLPSFRFIVRSSFAAPRTTTQSRYSSNSSWHLGSSCPFKNSSVYQWLKHVSYLFFNDAHGSSSFLGSFSSAIVSHRSTSPSLFSSMVQCFGPPKGDPECPPLSASPFAPRGRGVSLTLAGKGGRFPREMGGGGPRDVEVTDVQLDVMMAMAGMAMACTAHGGSCARRKGRERTEEGRRRVRGGRGGVRAIADGAGGAQEREKEVPGKRWRRATWTCVAMAAACLSTCGPASASTAAWERWLAAQTHTTGAGLAVRAAAAGMAAGWLHSLASPDHLAGLAPLTIGRSQVSSAALGGLWGSGHSVGQLIVGAVFVVFKERVEGLIPFMANFGTSLVGLVLVAIGIAGIRESRAMAEHGDEFVEDEMKIKERSRNLWLGTFASGVVYGLQPDAFFVIIPALALPTKAAVFSFVCMFVAGTILAMGSYTGLIGVLSTALGRKIPWVTERLSFLAGVVALSLGVALMFSGLGFQVPGLGFLA